MATTRRGPSDRSATLVFGESPLRRFLRGAALLVTAALFVSPFLWIISTSLRLPMESFHLPPSLLPTSFNTQNYKEVFHAVPFFRFFLNSLQIAAAATLGQALISSMAAYAFARIRFPGRGPLFLLVLSGLMISNQVIAIPQFILMAKLRMMDSYWTLVILWLVNPLGIFITRQSMMSIPDSYEEAAFIDGANRWWVFARVIVPMSLPSIAVSSVTWFVAVWNDFFRPLIFLNTWTKMTLPLGMTVLNSTYARSNLSAILAGVTLSLVPALLLYIFGQRYLVEGLTVGGVKQ
jgi:multiple sugar transport system permease protein